MSHLDYIEAAKQALYDRDPHVATAYAATGLLEQLTRIADMFQAIRDEAAAEREEALADDAFARANGQSWQDAAEGNFQCPPPRAT